MSDWNYLPEISRATAESKGLAVVVFTDREPTLTTKGGALHFKERNAHNTFVPLSSCYRVKGDGRYMWEVAMPKWLARKMHMI